MEASEMFESIISDVCEKMSRKDASLTPELLARIKSDWLNRALGYKSDKPIPKPIKIVEPVVKEEDRSPQPSPPNIKEPESDAIVSGSESEEDEESDMDEGDDPAMAEFREIKK